MARPTHLDLPNVHPGHTAHFTDYRAAEIGTVSMSPREPVEAGSYASFTLVFTAGRFVFLPGYEWSGNTALGGDRNVIFPEEGRVIRRSCHALVEDLSDHGSDALNARARHAALRAESRPALCVPHVGGR